MNVFDLAVAAVVLTAAVGGYRMGLLAGGTSQVFLLQGLVVATLLSPVVVDTFNDTAVRLMLGITLFVSAGWAAAFAGRRLGLEFRRQLVPAGYRDSDSTAGAAMGCVAVLAGVWLLVLPAMRAAPGWPSRLAERSLVGKAVDAALPRPPETSKALRWLTGPIAQPEVLTALGPAGDTSPPPTKLSLAPDLVARVSSSTVKIEGDACFLDREGSGFAVDRDLVVTNAHVVAGQTRPVVVRPDGRRLPAVVAVYDARRDLALLRVRGLGQEPLPLGTAKAGSPAAVFGHPEGQDKLEVSPAAIRQELVATIRDDELPEPSRREVYVLAADLAPGDSGGALVTPSGEVAGVAFAISSARTGVAFAVTTDELRPLLTLDRSGTADTGKCL